MEQTKKNEVNDNSTKKLTINEGVEGEQTLQIAEKDNTKKSNKDIKIDWSPEDNNYLNSVLEKLNLVIAMTIILAPIITSLSCLVGIAMDVLNVYLISYLLFVISVVLSFAINLRFFKFKKPSIMQVLLALLIVAVLVGGFVNKSLNMTFVFRMGLFIVFFVFYKVDKKYYKLLLYTFVLTLTICSIMGLCDLNNTYMPGFREETFPMSLQFMNPNYSGYITTMAIIMCIFIIMKYKTIVEQIVFWICFGVLNIAFFINGCYSAETAMFVGELFLLIYLWIKNKKCPWEVLVCMIFSILASFVRIEGVSTSGANYLLETIAMLDRKLGTHILEPVSRFLSKIFGGTVVTSVAGSDGWDRNELFANAIKFIFSGVKACIFGGGAELNYTIRVHNVYVQIWEEHGLITLGLYLTILVVAIIRLFKTKFSSHNIFVTVTLFVTLLISHTLGCLEQYSFTYYLCFLTVMIKMINEKYFINNIATKQSSNINFKK